MDGIKQVFYWTGVIGGVLLVLLVIGMVNSKGTHGMAAVAAGLGDVLKWAGELTGAAFSHL